MRPRVADLLGIARAGVMLALAAPCAPAAEPGADLRELIEQNRRLQEQVRTQQSTIDELKSASDRHEQELRNLQKRDEAPAPARAVPAGREREVRISAEAGLAFFETGAQGQFPKSEFRVDDPVIAIEAPVWKDIYFYTELKLLPREANEELFELGELYVDFENISAAWGQPGLLSFRAGRLNIPFGEEYLVRGPIANPLISHSLSDLWGVDEGVEIYGALGPVRYVLGVQNGGVSRLRDFNADKSVAARLGWDPTPWLHVSGSAMRTGELATVDDELSELWFGNAFFRALGPETSTGTFWANLVELDARARWKNGHAGGALGQVRFDDSDTTADNSRRLRYGYLELVQDINDRLFAATRYSEIQAPRGYPLAGWGRRGSFFFRPVLTEELRRFSLGLGYRIGQPLVVKFEYTWESGRMTTGESRDQENFFGSEIAVKF